MLDAAPKGGCAPDSQADATGGSQPARLRILVVDDDADTVMTLCTLLGLWGMNTLSARDGRAALDLATLHLPDAIIVDLSMPGMDGYELIRECRARPELQHSKIAVVSGFGQEDFIERSHRLGADLHLVKPVNLDSLQRFLRRIPPRHA